MQKNISCLVQALERLGMSYAFIDREKNLVRVATPGGPEFFELNKTPFNSEVVYSICRDKMHTYALLNDCIQMPLTHGYLDVAVPAAYRE